VIIDKSVINSGLLLHKMVSGAVVVGKHGRSANTDKIPAKAWSGVVMEIDLQFYSHPHIVMLNASDVDTSNKKKKEKEKKSNTLTAASGRTEEVGNAVNQAIPEEREAAKITNGAHVPSTSNPLKEMNATAAASAPPFTSSSVPSSAPETSTTAASMTISTADIAVNSGDVGFELTHLICSDGVPSLFHNPLNISDGATEGMQVQCGRRGGA
jgi:hypothetical protein